MTDERKNKANILGKLGKKRRKAFCVFALFLTFVFLFVSLFFVFKSPILEYLYKDYQAPAPILHSEWAKKPTYLADGDIYVSLNGSDENDGSKNSPFKTFERAKRAVREMDKRGREQIVVCVEGGDYQSTLSLNAEDGGSADCPIIYRGVNGTAVLDGGNILNPKDFRPATEYPSIRGRLSKTAKEKVVVLDLTQAPYSLTADDWDGLYPIGTYNTADRYQGDTTGHMYCELFMNDVRLNLARYPNDGYLYTGEPLVTGLDVETEARQDPHGDVYSVSEELGERISSWSKLSEVWAFGFWKYDWADGSSPLEAFDRENNALTLKYQSFFGTKEGAPYYFYNCLEELDSAGEWFLDRENGLLCLYPPEGFENAEINFSTAFSPIVQINASHVIIENLTVTCGRDDGIAINGSHNLVQDCKIKSVSGVGILVSGEHNVIRRNEVSHVGQGGIHVSGGDKKTLTAGNNVVDNNLIHDWSEIYKTYNAGVGLYGVGNVCSHNELYNAPHLGITYSGNNHVVEYNVLRNVCEESNDGGAIYAGRSWSSYGNVVRYNCVYDIGGNGYTPDGIYMDDALSGQNIYGNLLVNIPKYALHLGGGRDLKVRGNVIVNAGEEAIRYDARARDGALSETWFSEHVEQGAGDLWRDLYASPWRSELWRQAFQEYETLSDDFSDPDSPDFIPNPANSTVSENVAFDKDDRLGAIDGAVERFSKIENNATYALSSLNGAFHGLKKGNYAFSERFLKRAKGEIQPLPLSEMGRY